MGGPVQLVNMQAEVLVNVVCPSPEQLGVIIKSVQCSQCGLVFQNEPRLRLHDLKVHKQANLEKNEKKNIQYHCPVTACVYALRSQRYFSSMKYLKQHYLKVHAAKIFSCTQCSKCFSTEAAKDAHIRVCGVQFTCDCSKAFSTYEALLTHAKRFQHVINDKYKLLVKRTRVKNHHAASPRVVNPVKPITILPNDVDGSTTRTYNVNGKLKVTCDASMQTDELRRPKKISSPSKNATGKRRVSQQTQTVVPKTEKRQRTSAETQTSFAYSEHDRAQDCPLPDSNAWQPKRNPDSLVTSESVALKEDLPFVDNFESQNLFSNSPLPLSHDVGLHDLWEVKNTSGTQTTDEDDLLGELEGNVDRTDLNLFYNHDEPTLMHCGSQTTNLNRIQYMEDNSIVNALSFGRIGNEGHSESLLDKMFDHKFSSIETQTELRHLLDQDSSFAYSSDTETQTTESFRDMDQLLYSNTCTQTSDEILLSDLGFSNIQTQTAWPRIGDATVSTETQTNISKSKRNSSNVGRAWLNARTNHMETQTELLNLFQDLN